MSVQEHQSPSGPEPGPGLLRAFGSTRDATSVSTGDWHTSERARGKHPDRRRTLLVFRWSLLFLVALLVPLRMYFLDNAQALIQKISSARLNVTSLRDTVRDMVGAGALAAARRQPETPGTETLAKAISEARSLVGRLGRMQDVSRFLEARSAIEEVDRVAALQASFISKGAFAQAARLNPTLVGAASRAITRLTAIDATLARSQKTVYAHNERLALAGTLTATAVVGLLFMLSIRHTRRSGEDRGAQRGVSQEQRRFQALVQKGSDMIVVFGRNPWDSQISCIPTIYPPSVERWERLSPGHSHWGGSSAALGTRTAVGGGARSLSPTCSTIRMSKGSS